MQGRVELLKWVWLAGLVAAVGCGGGGDDDDDDASTGSAPALGGAASGGSAAVGGSTSGGSSAVGGSGETGGTGAGTGGAENSAECPATAPSSGDDCEVTDGFLSCNYAESSCLCGQFGPMEGTWQCSEVAACPETMPEDGSSCSSFTLDCTYADGSCACRGRFGGPGGGGLQWDCGGDTQDGCPPERPESGDPCDTDGQTCEYGRFNGSCVCSAADGWTCD